MSDDLTEDENELTRYVTKGVLDVIEQSKVEPSIALCVAGNALITVVCTFVRKDMMEKKQGLLFLDDLKEKIDSSLIKKKKKKPK